MKRGLEPALVIELAALAAIAVLAWVLGGTATTAWLARVGRLDGYQAPDIDAVRRLARQAALLFTVGIAVLAVARVVCYRRARDPIRVPWLLPATLAACLLGLVIHHATVEVSGGTVLLPSAAGFAQGVLLGCVIGAVLLVLPVDLAELAIRARIPIALTIGAIFLALAVLGSGPAGSGTRINLGPIQPIELVKPLAILFLAAFLGARASKLRWQRRRFLGLRWPRLELLVPALLVLVLIVAGLYVIGDLGPVLLLAFVFLGMFYLVSRATGWAVLALAVVALLLVILGRWPELAGGGTVQTRLRMWHDPWSNGLTFGHQLGEGLWAVAAGGYAGQGLGEAAIPVLPAGKTDLMLATMTEQLGVLGLLAYQLLLAAIVLGCLRVASQARTAERSLIAGGVAILVLVQWIVIQAGTLGQLPLTGIVVPFLSSGRSSMVVFLAIVAMVVRLAADGPPREPSVELGELHAGVRGMTVVVAVAVALAVLAGIAAAIVGRHATSARGIVTRLGDGVLVQRHNPRLLALITKIQRGTIADRNGAPLATSTSPTARSYPLGAGLGTLLGVHPTRVLLPAWSLERLFDHRLRGYPEHADGPRYRDFDARAGAGALPSPDLRRFAKLLDLDRDARVRAVAALDADVPARSVTLTIDAALQARVAKLLAAVQGKRVAAAAVVMDVDTGQVLARAQVPDYDPNAPAWQAHVLANDAPYLARFRGAYGEWPDKTGVHGMFQSGSVAKLFTALAAVKAGSATATFPCTERDQQGPYFTRPGWPKPIHDHAGDRNHDNPGIVEAIAVSCNVYFGQLGLAIGREPLIALRAAGVDVGFSGDLDPGDPGSRQLASTAFGQGVMVMSTMQAARLVAAIASGGTYRRCPPTMELAAACPATPLVDDPVAIAPIVAGMRRVMTAGTGAGLRAPAGLRVYGKTGTADVRGFRGEEPFGIKRAQVASPHSWFVAFAEPASATENAVGTPGRLVVVVVVPRGGTGASAAGPIVMQILGAAKELGYLGGAP
ncbi:MAG: FtsW/RodA/SpoVE family cell cycle protein [Deltaproteobacteria bacterium]|nr:FtsW/RodA/SpoVE family cell cycle protein [Deltaproteobacteria bacterium]